VLTQLTRKTSTATIIFGLNDLTLVSLQKLTIIGLAYQQKYPSLSLHLA